MTIIIGSILYLMLLTVAVLAGKFMKECDASMMSSSESTALTKNA